MELIDIYDKDGHKTGAVRDKEAPLGPEEYRMAVGMWIVDKGGRIFLTRRSMEKKYAPGKWENPAGHVHDHPRPYIGRDFGVRMDVDLESVRFQKGETSAAKWVTFEEFAEMALAGEFAQSLTDHMCDYEEAFLAFTGHPGSDALDFLTVEAVK